MKLNPIQNKLDHCREYLKETLMINEKYEKGCGFLCEGDPKIVCAKCDYYIWHARCLKELEGQMSDDDYQIEINEAKNSVNICPECWARDTKVAKYPRILQNVNENLSASSNI